MPEGSSLKEKRQVIKSIIAKLKQRFNISVAEVGHLEILRRAEIGFAAVSNETGYLEKLIARVVNFIELDSRVQIININKEIF